MLLSCREERLHLHLLQRQPPTRNADCNTHIHGSSNCDANGYTYSNSDSYPPTDPHSNGNCNAKNYADADN